MLERMVAGRVPRKHHIQLRDEQGRLLFEECLTQQGFEGPYTIAYHQREPHTQSLSEVKGGWELPRAIASRALAKRHYKTQELQRWHGPAVNVRTPLLFNADVTLSVVFSSGAGSVYFANAGGDDLFYVH